MFEIVVSEATRGRFEAWLGGELLCTSRTPLLSAARELVRRGVSESAPLAMRHAGSDVVAMRTTVGVAARLTVKEGPTRFVVYDPSGGRPEGVYTASDGLEAVG